MIVVEKKHIHHIPVLHVVNQAKYSEKLPLVIFLHGFTSTKERNLHYSYLLAEKGFRVIMPDAKAHGMREEGLSEKELGFRFWEIVMTTIKELSFIKSELETEGLIDPMRIGVAGTSMGAITTLGALAEYDWITSAVSLMGNPAYKQFALWQLDQLERHNISLDPYKEEIEGLLFELEKYDLSIHSEKLQKRPLLFWHGKMDQVVPYQAAYDFYQRVGKSYGGNDDYIDFILDEQAGHNVTNKGVERTAEWFERHLSPEGLKEDTVIKQ